MRSFGDGQWRSLKVFFYLCRRHRTSQRTVLMVYNMLL